MLLLVNMTHDTTSVTPESAKPIDWTEKGQEAVSKVFLGLSENNLKLVEAANLYLYSHDGGSAGISDALDAVIRPTDADNNLANGDDQFFSDALGHTNEFVAAIDAHLNTIGAVAKPDIDSPESLDSHYQNAQDELAGLINADNQADFDMHADKLLELAQKSIQQIRTDAEATVNSSGEINQLSTTETSRFDWWTQADGNPDDHQGWVDGHRQSLHQFNDLIQTTTNAVQSNAEFVKSQVTDENADPVREFIKGFQVEFAKNLTEK